MWENKQTALFDNLMLPQHFRKLVSLAGNILFIFDLKSCFFSSTLNSQASIPAQVWKSNENS